MRLIEGLALFTAAICLVVAIDGHQAAKDAEKTANANERTLVENRRTLCGAARIVAYNPVNQLPGEPDGRFRKRIAAYQDFLRLAALIDCRTILQQFREEVDAAAAGESVPEVEGITTTPEMGTPAPVAETPGRPGTPGAPGPPGTPGAPAPGSEEQTPTPGTTLGDAIDGLVDDVCETTSGPDTPGVCLNP